MKLDKITPPRLIERACGGWLALSGIGESLKIGVVAETADDARNRFAAAVEKWREALSTQKGYAESVPASMG